MKNKGAFDDDDHHSLITEASVVPSKTELRRLEKLTEVLTDFSAEISSADWRDILLLPREMLLLRADDFFGEKLLLFRPPPAAPKLPLFLSASDLLPFFLSFLLRLPFFTFLTGICCSCCCWPQRSSE